MRGLDAVCARAGGDLPRDGERVAGALGKPGEFGVPDHEVANNEPLLGGLLGTPMLAPIWLQDAPERRAWSTK
jgi:hypothetical protein